MGKRIIILLLVVAVIFTACAEMPPSRVISNPGAPPQSISIELASQVEHKSYSPEVLSDPVIQSIIAQCEQQGGEHCREQTVATNTRTKFVRTQDDEFWAFVYLGGLERDRDYAARARLFDPDRNMRAKVICSIHTPSKLPPDFSATFKFHWTPRDPSTWQLGQWRLEIAINGQVVVERTFLVVDPAEVSVKKPEVYYAVFCSSIEEKWGTIYPKNLTDRFTSGDGKKVYIFIDWYDWDLQTKNTVSTVRYEWYDPKGVFDGSWGKEYIFKQTQYKTYGFKKLDKEDNTAPGQWTVKVFFNNHYIFSKKFIILENAAQ